MQSLKRKTPRFSRSSQIRERAPQYFSEITQKIYCGQEQASEPLFFTELRVQMRTKQPSPKPITPRSGISGLFLSNGLQVAEETHRLGAYAWCAYVLSFYFSRSLIVLAFLHFKRNLAQGLAWNCLG